MLIYTIIYFLIGLVITILIGLFSKSKFNDDSDFFYTILLWPIMLIVVFMETIELTIELISNILDSNIITKTLNKIRTKIRND